MPWCKKPMKDVVACDKPREVGKRTLIPVDFRMGKPIRSNILIPYTEYIGV